MAKSATRYNPAPWVHRPAYLMADNSIVQAPEVEVSESHRRVRIVGTSASVAMNNMASLMWDAVKTVAEQRSTTVVSQLPDPEQERREHMINAPGGGIGYNWDYGHELALHFTDPDKADNQAHKTVVYFEYQSVEIPALTAVAWVVLQRANNNHLSDATYGVQSGLTHRYLHPSEASHAASMRLLKDEWHSPFTRYDNSTEAIDAKARLADIVPFGIPFANVISTSQQSVVGSAVTMLAAMRAAETIEVPIWRDAMSPDTMTFRFKSTNLTASIYSQMVDFLQTKVVMDRIQDNFKQIVRDMASLGFVRKGKGSSALLDAVLNGTQSDITASFVPHHIVDNEYVTGEVTVDHDHFVSVDFASGTFLVTCTKDNSDALDQWKFERARAEIVGELPAFLAALAQNTKKRSSKKFDEIVKSRTPEKVEDTAVADNLVHAV